MISPRAAADRVGAAEATHDVITVERQDHIVARGSRQHVRSRRSDQGRGLSAAVRRLRPHGGRRHQSSAHHGHKHHDPRQPYPSTPAWRLHPQTPTPRSIERRAYTVLAVAATTADARIKIGFVCYDSPGSDTGSNANLNGEYVKIKNTGTRARVLTGWRFTTTSTTATRSARSHCAVAVTSRSTPATARTPPRTGTGGTKPARVQEVLTTASRGTRFFALTLLGEQATGPHQLGAGPDSFAAAPIAI